MSILYNIKYSITHFTIKFQENSELNISKESSIRGVIGQILLKKFCILNDIDKEMVKRNTYQGLKTDGCN